MPLDPAAPTMGRVRLSGVAEQVMIDITLKFVLDGVIYGLVTAATFGWLWPGA